MRSYSSLTFTPLTGTLPLIFVESPKETSTPFLPSMLTRSRCCGKSIALENCAYSSDRAWYFVFEKEKLCSIEFGIYHFQNLLIVSEIMFYSQQV